MTDTQTKELQVTPKQEAAPPAEPTSSGPLFTPAVDIFETPVLVLNHPGSAGKTGRNSVYSLP